MRITIHRGTKEIGGTCIHLSTATTTILLDLGLPLSPDSGRLDVASLRPDAVLISHPHQDHFGLINQLAPDVPVYIGQLGKNLIDVVRLNLGKDLHRNNFHFFKPWEKFRIGDITITPYLVDHSAVDAYAFLIEGEGKRVFYSGDFRGHGRKAVLYDRMVANPPVGIDLLLLEGTMMARSNDDFPYEEAVETAIFETIRNQRNISFLICSSQNIDRIVSAYRACLKARKTLVIDIYTAWVLEKVREVAPGVPGMDWDRVRIYADNSHYKKLKQHPEYFGDFTRRVFNHRVTRDELAASPSSFLYVAKMSSFMKIQGFYSEHPVNVIYSQWLGYLKYPSAEYYGAEEVSAFRSDPHVTFSYAHTSGHATVDMLQKFARALRARMVVPIHTEHAERFVDLFDNVTLACDGEVFTV